MKISVNTYSFRQAMNDGRMTQLDCIYKAREMGFDGVEFSTLLHSDALSDAEYAEKVRDEANKVGIELAAFLFPADFLKEQSPYPEKEIGRVKELVDIAKIMGVRIIRHDVSRGDGHTPFRKALPIFTRACREITEYAAEKGIRTSVENHGMFCQGGERLEALYHAVDHENFGLLVDIGNFVCTDDCPEKAVMRTAPYAVHAHAKDFYIRNASAPNPGKGFFKSLSGNFLRGAIIGHGDVDVPHCITALKMAGYDGWLGLEFEGMEDCFLGIEVGLNNLRQYLEM